MKNLYLPLTFFSQKKTKMSSHLFTVIWYAATVVDCVFVWFVGVPGTQLNEYLPFKWFHVRRYTERMWHVDGISVEKNQCRQHRSGKSIVNPFIDQYMQYSPVAHSFAFPMPLVAGRESHAIESWVYAQISNACILHINGKEKCGSQLISRFPQRIKNRRSTRHV